MLPPTIFMLPPTIYCHGRYYELRLSGFHSREAGTGRVLSRFEAERVLAEAMRDGGRSSELRRLYMEIAHAPSIVHVSNEHVLRGLVARVDGGNGFGDFAVVEVDPFGRAVSKPLAQVESKEAQRVDGLLKELGPADIHHQGNLYRLVPAPKSDCVADRDRYEVIDGREARRVMQAMAGEQNRPERQKTTLAELAAQLDKPRVEPDLELLVLRRIRTYARPPGEDSGPITPSQLRKSRETHWIELVLQDQDDEPLPALLLEITTSDRQKHAVATNPTGTVRLADLREAGSCQIHFQPRKAASQKG